MRHFIAVLFFIAIAVFSTASGYELKNNATGKVLTESQFRAQFPNTFFPQVLNQTVISQYGYSFYDPPLAIVPTVPESISPRQARLVLNRYNLRTTVETIVQILGKDAQDTWEYATEVRRSNPILIAVCQQAGMTDAQIDQMFVEGSQL